MWAFGPKVSISFEALATALEASQRWIMGGRAWTRFSPITVGLYLPPPDLQYSQRVLDPAGHTAFGIIWLLPLRCMGFLVAGRIKK